MARLIYELIQIQLGERMQMQIWSTQQRLALVTGPQEINLRGEASCLLFSSAPQHKSPEDPIKHKCPRASLPSQVPKVILHTPKVQIPWCLTAVKTSLQLCYPPPSCQVQCTFPPIYPPGPFHLNQSSATSA